MQNISCTFLNKIDLPNNVKDSPVMYWIPKMHKNPINFCFIIAFPVCSIKPVSKDITSILKLVYEKVERYTKGKVWSGIKTLWTIQDTLPSNL